MKEISQWLEVAKRLPTYEEVKPSIKSVPLTQEPAWRNQDIRTSSPFVAVLAKNQYGQVRFYPANNIADAVLRIQGGKTLTTNSLEAVRQMGFEVSVIQEEIRL